MLSWSLLVALAFTPLQDVPAGMIAGVPSRATAGGSAEAVASPPFGMGTDEQAAARAALLWFADEVAFPVLRAASPAQARRTLAEKATIAAQARGALVTPVFAALARNPAGWAELSTAAVDDRTKAVVADRLGAEGQPLIDALEISHRGVAEYVEFAREHAVIMRDPKVLPAFLQLVPSATDTDVLLLILALAFENDHGSAFRADVLSALCADAYTQVIRHHADLRALFTKLDPEWGARRAVDDWADAQSASVMLSPSEYDRLSAALQSPPAANSALRRAARRWR